MKSLLNKYINKTNEVEKYIDKSISIYLNNKNNKYMMEFIRHEPMLQIPNQYFKLNTICVDQNQYLINNLDVPNSLELYVFSDNSNSLNFLNEEVRKIIIGKEIELQYKHITYTFENSFEITNTIKFLIVHHFNDLIENKVSIYDIYHNSRKLNYFSKTVRNHEVNKISGKKQETFFYCQKYNIKTPMMYLIKNDNTILYGNVDILKKLDSFVLKSNNGCSTQGVHIFVKHENNFKDMMHNKVYDTEKFNELLSSYSSCIIEEKIGDIEHIPYDLKVYCNNKNAFFIMVVNRNYKFTDKKVYTFGYDLSTLNFISKPFLDSQIRFNEPPDGILEEMKKFLDEKRIHLIKLFAEELLNKIDYNHFISLDLFFYKDSIYLGEFTKTPGGFLYHILPGDIIETIFHKPLP